MSRRRIVVAASAVLMLAAASTAQAGLVNGSFELPVIAPNTFQLRNDAQTGGAGSVPGWNTTAPDHQIEIWSTGFLGVPSYDGNQFAELNANVVSTLYQDSSGIAAGLRLGFQFAHRGRQGVDVMAATITDLGSDGALGGGDDTVLFTKQYSDGIAAWGFYTSASEAPIFALGNTIRFSYVSVSSVGGAAIGNFLDAADFGVGVAVTNPEPSTMALFGLGLAAGGVFLRRRRAATKRASQLPI